METEQLKQLIHAVSSSKLQEFRYEENGIAVVMKKEEAAPVTENRIDDAKSCLTIQQETDKTEEKEEAHLVKSPLVGTFYIAPEEGADPFVHVGDSVTKGQTLAIVEAMKLMNEIECDGNGTITKIYVQNGQSVEYGQPLFAIR